MEKIELLNRRLVDHYGQTIDTGHPNFRIVWSEDQLESRYDEYEDRTEEGFFIRRVKETRVVPKYNYIKERHILERLTEVPVMDSQTLHTKFSYEPIWVFETNDGKVMPVLWNGIKMLIDTLLEKMHTRIEGKYVASNEEELLKEQKRIDEIKESLFGNETATGDALAHGDGVGYGVK